LEKSESLESLENSKELNNEPFEEKIGLLNETTDTQQNTQDIEKNQNIHNVSVEPILEKVEEEEKNESNNEVANNEVSKAISSGNSLRNSQKEEIPVESSTYLLSLKELAFVSYGGAPLLESIEKKNEIEKLKYGSFVKTLQKIEVDGVSYSKIVYFGKELNSEVKIGWTKTVNLSFVEKLLKTSEEVIFKDLKKIPGRVRKVRGIYISRHTASMKSNLDRFADFAKRTNLNAFVIDVKDDDGFMLFQSLVAPKYAQKANKLATYSKDEIKEIIKELKAKGFYLIARIVCFKDPTYASAHLDRAIVYKETGQPYMGIYKVPWASAYDRQLWQYNIDVAKEAIEVGFDEIQYDYVRFPELTKEDRMLVNLRQVGNESMSEAIYKFLVKSKMELATYNIPLAADIFGLVSTAVDDMGIGQYWELVSSAVDYVCPMVYPSHYAKGSFGLSVPDAYPYEVVYRSVFDGLVRNRLLSTPAKVRPWIQAFTATWVKGHIQYGENEIRKQIKALKDLGIEEYMLWNASNRYLEMKYE
ncbi:MAG: putative glycoside hydrolase, partial [Fervidobacterium sp.]